MELIAPAGSKEAFKAAIIGGADAIYLGGKTFGARGLAENFSKTELKTAVRLAHKNKVKIYVTVNTLIKEDELQSVFSYIDYLESIKADAVIIQDRGLLRLIRENFSIRLHASTQMGIHSDRGVAWAEKNGISRVILARELHMEEIEEIRKRTEVELEVFIHGALCYSFSGQCLFSSMLGGRSGNRGFCTQPCRKRYTLSNTKEGYFLSTADLFGCEALPDLIRVGINALKIEGRMRSPLYVYLTSKIYSNAIRRVEKGLTPLVTEREKEMLEVIFNRGFSKGNLLKDNIMHSSYSGSRGLFLGNVHFDGEKGVIKAGNLESNDGVTFYRQDKKIGGFSIKKVEKNGGLMLFPPFGIPKGEYQVYKTKDREFDSIQQKINAMDFTSDKLEKRFRKFLIKPIKRNKTKSELSYYVSSLKTLKKVIPFADRVYFDWHNRFEEALSLCKKAEIECVLVLPRLSFKPPITDAENIMICSIDQFEKYQNRKVFGHYSLNFFNSFTIPYLFQYTLSVELSKENIEEIACHYSGRIDVMVFGRIDLMMSRDSSLGEGVLVDTKKVKFPFYRDRFGLTHICNSADLLLLDYLDDLEEIGVDSFGIDLRRRDSNLSELVAKAFYQKDNSKKSTIKRKCGSVTARHYRQGVK